MTQQVTDVSHSYLAEERGASTQSVSAMSQTEVSDKTKYFRDEAPDIETSSSDYASRFAGQAGDYMLSVQARTVAEHISKYPGSTVLDVGGGHGQLRALYQSFQMTYTIHGSHEACFSDLSAPDRNEKRVVADLRRLPFEDQSFDVVVAVRLLTHLDDWPMVLAEMCRVSRKIVVFDYPTKSSLNVLTPFLFKFKKDIEKNTRRYTTFRREDFRQQLETAGLHEIREVRQFFLPMVVHRILKGNFAAQIAEKLAAKIGLTRLVGSPVVLGASRSSQS